jgi:two-component system sensor histidine kinase KdpD
MNDEYKKNPDELLKAIKQQETTSAKAKLKIFLGMAAGSGKTYAMLQAAQVLKQHGIDVLVGVVNTHGRVETAALLKGLKVLPEKSIEYKGIALSEFDIDEVLRLKPQVVLIDEMAHTNATGSRHPKRWQDVKEILENGIDVYTTLNVQHIESLKDIVEGITGITIRETVNDSIIEEASSIELIDLTPDELLQRLKEGKVYLGDKSELAAKNFFQEDRLTALREIALRFVAEKVDHELQEMVSIDNNKLDWKPRERLMIALSQSPLSQKLIRTTRRLASNLHAPWYAAYIDTGLELSSDENNQLNKNIDLARSLGAEVIMTRDTDIVDGIKRIAKQRGVTQIILGRTPKKNILSLFAKESIVDRLSRECSDIDIHIIRQELALTKVRKKIIAFNRKKNSYAYFGAIVTVGLVVLGSWLLWPFIGYKVIGVLFLITILGLSLLLSKGPVFFATVLLGIIWQYFFVPPYGIVAFHAYDDLSLLCLFFLTSIATGILVDRSRQRKDILEKREKSALGMYDIIRKIANTPRGDTEFNSVKHKLGDIFSGTFDIIIKKTGQNIILDNTIPLLSDEKEKNAAIWVFEHGNEAGWSTDTLPQSKNLYIPLVGLQETVGILIYRPKQDKFLSLEDKNFLHTVSQQLARFFERRLSDDNIKINEQRKRIDKMHATILKKISLVFRQPLSVFDSSLMILKEKLLKGGDQELLNEVEKMEGSQNHLRETLESISAMALLSEGFAPTHLELQSLNEILDQCLENVNKMTQDHTLIVNIENDLPLLRLDNSLFTILLLNLVANAVVFSSKKSTIEIEAKKQGNYLILSVADEGRGIPEDQLEAVFDLFYTLKEDSQRSMGLGLAIAKAIAELHHGYIKAANRPTIGAIFTLYLPY